MVKNNQSNTVQVFWAAAGNFASFGFAMISSMILSRFLLKEDYGTYRQVIYIYSTLLMVFTLGLPKAFSYFLPRVELGEAKDITQKINSVFFVIGLVFSLLLFLFSSQIASILKNDSLSFALKIFSPVPLFMLPTMGLESILATYKKTQILAIYTIITRIIMLLCVALPVVIFKGDYISATIGFVVSSFFTLIIGLYLKNIPFKTVKKIKTNVSYRHIFKYSLPLMHASLWGILISSADQFFISRFFGTEIFAEFSNGSLELPFVGMIIGASSTVLMPLFSRKIYENVNPKQEILPIWRSAFEKTAKIIYPLVIFFWFFADIVMVILYGNSYEASSVYFRIKLIVNFFTLITFAPLILAIGAVKFYKNVHMYGAIILIALEYISIQLFHSAEIITVISVICQIGRILVMLSFVARFFELSLIDLFPIKLLINILFPSIIILFTIRYIYTYFSINNFIQIIVGFILYILIYGTWAYFRKIDYLPIIKPIILIFIGKNKTIN
ncbi:MAG: oligosaccharide flippase family protein [Prevotella sp.]|jgi:O-antigen/teichoic acid export membrane protein|nr:oligosaccharide flippase family protein [Prevotella sp.]